MATKANQTPVAAAPRFVIPVVRLVACLLVLAGYVALLVMHPARVAPKGMAKPAIDAQSAAMYKACEQALEAHDWAKAAGLASKLRALYPENHIYARDLALAKHGLGQYAEEAKVWESYMLIAPIPVHGCPDVGNAWQKAGNATKALQAFKRCWQLEPQNSDMIFNFARALERMGQNAEAAAMYRAGLLQSPKYFDLTIGLGRVTLRSGDAAEARRLAEQVLAERPDYSDALLLLGSANLKLNDAEGAKAAFRRGIEASPNYTDIYVALGRVLEDEKKNDEALAVFQKALSIDPSREDARRHVNRLQGAR